MRVGIVGAGAVGGYLAVALSAEGHEVVLVGRRWLDAPESMTVVRLNGTVSSAGARLSVTHAMGDLASVDMALVAVKAQDTERVARELADAIAADVPVISFQNGLRNLERLRSALRGPVIGGVVGFNVVSEGTVRREATKGKLFIGAGAGHAKARVRELAASLVRAQIDVALRRDIERTIAGKLLINLGNGIAAATGLPTVRLLESRDARWCFAQCIREALRVMRSAGLRPESVALVPPGWLARALMLPDRLVAPMSQAIASVDPTARASTLQDLERGVATEIDELNGAILWLAQRSGSDAPINRLVADVVHEHERAGPDAIAFVPPSELRRRIESLPR
jgi:2-dehydropantoate 2-reductase